MKKKKPVDKLVLSSCCIDAPIPGKLNRFYKTNVSAKTNKGDTHFFVKHVPHNVLETGAIIIHNLVKLCKLT